MGLADDLTFRVTRRRSSLSDPDVSGGFENIRWLAISHLEADPSQLESAACGA
jgi:hypothetical protein